jgi:hypothetical protein
MTTRFDAPWDRQLRLATWLAGLILVAVGAVMLAVGLAVGELWPFFLVACLLAAVLTGAWLLAPAGFELQGRELIVRRRILAVRIRLEDIRAVDRLADQDLVGSIRLGGNGGLFGWYGRYWNRRLGPFRLYATRRTGMVRIDTERELFVLSPADPDAFVTALLQRAPRARRGAEPAAGRRRRLTIQVLRGVGTVALIVAVLVGALFVALRGLSPVAVRVDEDAVVVERRWWDPVEIPLRTVQGSWPLPSQQARRWWRTAGTDLGEVRYGRWASRELGEFRLYAWRHGPYVVLETSEGRVILTPDEPEEFVEEVRASRDAGRE